VNRLLLAPEELDGASATIHGRRARHIIEVLGAKPGSQIRAGIIDGGLGHALVKEVGADSVKLEVHLDSSPPAPAPLTLILALPRPKALGRILQSVTALGVKQVLICNSARVEKFYWEAHQVERDVINRHILLGLEQAGDTLWPKVTMHRLFRPFVEDVLPGELTTTERWVAHPYTERKLPNCNERPCVLAIGPEGGWVDFEIEMFQRLEFESGSFGTRTLPCETAVAAMIGHMVGC
jgi:16S rRNA (uracil1498-N3)-methyltransferase